MKRLLLGLALFTLFILTSCSSSKKMSNSVKEYSVETMGVGIDGTYLIKVTDYFRTTDERVYIDGLKKDAVHCVIYKGIPAGNGSINQPALMTENTKVEGSEEALNAFFDNRKYLDFVYNIVDSSKEITRIKGSKDYRISLVISVNKDALRKYLIDNNIVKPLNYLF